jgi:uncharacterized BrkB/YihY/UPF0761 family membrane protein
MNKWMDEIRTMYVDTNSPEHRRYWRRQRIKWLAQRAMRKIIKIGVFALAGAAYFLLFALLYLLFSLLIIIPPFLYFSGDVKNWHEFIRENNHDLILAALLMCVPYLSLKTLELAEKGIKSIIKKVGART